MDHREVREYLPAYADQAGGPRASAVEEHLRTCADCRGQLEQYRSMAVSLRSLAEHRVEPPAWLLGTLLETIGERAERRAAIRQKTERIADPGALVAGGALVAAGLAGALVFRGIRRRRRASLRRRLQEALAEA